LLALRASVKIGSPGLARTDRGPLPDLILSLRVKLKTFVRF
jgi:hypothetical protein